MVDDTNVRAGQCHCGAVRFEVTLGDGFNSALRCNCSYCRMRGAVVVMAEMGGIKFLQGEDALTSYRFHTGAAQHFFCSRCGIYTHHQRRSNQNMYAVNVACLDGVSPFDFSEVPVSDGLHHSSDTAGRRAGQARCASSRPTDHHCQPTSARRCARLKLTDGGSVDDDHRFPASRANTPKRSLAQIANGPTADSKPGTIAFLVKGFMESARSRLRGNDLRLTFGPYLATVTKRRSDGGGLRDSN